MYGLYVMMPSLRRAGLARIDAIGIVLQMCQSLQLAVVVHRVG